MERDVLVDFNSMDSDGHVTTLVRHARAGLKLTPGKVVRVGDGEGSSALAQVVKRRRWPPSRRAVVLWVDQDSFESELPASELPASEVPANELPATETPSRNSDTCRRP